MLHINVDFISFCNFFSQFFLKEDRKKSLGDLSTGHGFDSGCTCFESCEGVVNGLRGIQIMCHCDVSICSFIFLHFTIIFDHTILFSQAPRLSAELNFVKALTSIGNILKCIQTKEARTTKLMAELTTINFNLPARVWIPLCSDIPHHVVRIPPQMAAVLNSKDKVKTYRQDYRGKLT